MLVRIKFLINILKIQNDHANMGIKSKPKGDTMATLAQLLYVHSLWKCYPYLAIPFGIVLKEPKSLHLSMSDMI